MSAEGPTSPHSPECLLEEEQRPNFRERLKGKGQELLHQLEVNDRMVFFLQESPRNHRGRARCRAEDCVYVLANHPDGRYITDDYRICVDKGRSSSGKHYYHVLCFECMIDLKPLISSKFWMAGPSWIWGLMVRKWFKHKGSIALDKIALFLEERDAYNKENREFSGAYITWSRDHRKCEAGLRTCSCPPEPKGPDKPVLKDYTTRGEEGCNLSDVLHHPRVEDPLEEFITCPSSLPFP